MTKSKVQTSINTTTTTPSRPTNSSAVNITQSIQANKSSGIASPPPPPQLPPQ